MYVNYHKHTDYSSITVPDTHIKTKDYFERMLELGHNVYFTTEHGYGGNIFDPFMVRETDERYKDIKICFGVEAYMTIDNDNEETKTRDNYHIVILARTDDARKKINKIISNANKNNYYYRARINLKSFDIFDEDDIYITTACIGGLLRDDVGVGILKSLVDKFCDSVYLEVQNHNDPIQKEINKKALSLSKELGIKLIHANDSHYIYPEQGNERLIYLQGSGITYDNEDSFQLDYPDYDSILKGYKKQGVLIEEQVKEALNNTMIFADCEEIKIDKTIKMPNLYKELTPQQRMKKLEDLVYERWEKEKANVMPWDIDHIEEEIEFELDIIRDTNEAVHTADYFLLNTKVVDESLEKGGILTMTGRGSCGSLYINYLLGLTGINRFLLDVPLYPTRFISKSRLLETRSLPDIDFNTGGQEPFIDATKKLLGENSCYPLLAYGTTKESGSFRNYCRWIEKYVKDKDENKLIEISERLGIPISFLQQVIYEHYNELAKEISSTNELSINDKSWQKIFTESQKFVGSISSSSQHPCSVLLFDGDIESELGVIKVGEVMCVPITSIEVDHFKYLKNDYLIVKVWRIIDGVFKDIGIPTPNVEELIDLLDDKVWNLYSKGLTATLNQTDSNFATNYIMKYKPRSYQELSQFVAGIRPGFKSLLEGFLNREKYSTGVKALDEVLEDTNHYLLYQESIMKYLMWLGIPEDQTYGLISKIAKKTLTDEQIEKLHSTLGSNWLKLNGTMEGFEDSWQVVEDASKYSFNASHSIAVAFDSLYGAYLKANYPLEYFTVALNEFIDDTEKIDSLTSELPKFGIKISTPKFSNPSGTYSYDKGTNTIYQGIGSMKYISQSVGNTLKTLSKIDFTSFIDLLYVLNDNGINKRQIDNLIRSGFFDERFPNQAKCLYLQDVYEIHKKNKNISKSKIGDDELFIRTITKMLDNFDIQDQAKAYKVWDMKKFLEEFEWMIDIPDLSVREKIANQVETTGSLSLTMPDLDKKYVVVKGLNIKYSPIFDAYCLANGRTTKVKVYKNPSAKHQADGYTTKPFKNGDILYVNKFEKKPRSIFIDGEWKKIEPTEYEWWAKEYEVVEYIRI